MIFVLAPLEIRSFGACRRLSLHLALFANIGSETYLYDRQDPTSVFFLLVYWNFTFFVLTASRADNLRRLKSHQPASLWPKSVWNAASSNDIKGEMEYFVAFKVLALCSQWGKFWKFKPTVAADCWLPVGRQSVIELGYLVHQRALASFLHFFFKFVSERRIDQIGLNFSV